MSHHVLFLTLKVFSVTGGIEKVCRVFGRALFELCKEENVPLQVNCMYDSDADVTDKYFPADIFHGYSGKKIEFVLKSVQQGRNSSVVVLSHINLLSVAYMIRRLSPNTKIVLLAHGIEVWRPLAKWKRKMLQKCDLVLPVSEFTKEKIIELHGVKEEQCLVLKNCLDPFLPGLKRIEKNERLSKKYNLQKDDKILMTLSRLNYTERYKGYEKVITAMKDLHNDVMNIKYVIIGKYDDKEKQRLDKFISDLELSDSVIFTGFVPDEEIAEYFSLADAYIMPSTKEGFGIVFIEAMYYGMPVIAGSKDGSVDALSNGELGTLVNPESQEELDQAIERVLANKEKYKPDQWKLLNKFSYPVYKENIRQSILYLFREHEEVV